MATPLDELNKLLDIQLTDGTWNYDPYMQGMANGMLMAKSLLDGKEPVFKDAPKQWLCNIMESSDPARVVMELISK